MLQERMIDGGVSIPVLIAAIPRKELTEFAHTRPCV
jgi:hypothetical protein